MSSRIIEKINYDMMGTKNETAFPLLFVNLCQMTQKELKMYLTSSLLHYGYDVVSEDGFLYAKGTMPVVLTAHMDTVHKEQPVKDYYDWKTQTGDHIISSPQGIGGDDRCGVYMILSILATTDYRPYIIFCEDEEIGGVGSSKFVKTKYIDELENVKFFIELDRGNGSDLVFYNDANEEFHGWCEEITGYTENIGSFSDISNLCPWIGISGVNISCGYYNAHTTSEYVVLSEMLRGITVTIELLEAAQNEEVGQFLYTERRYDDFFFDSYRSKKLDPFGTIMTFYYGKDEMETVEGESQYSCIAQFLMGHPSLCWNDIMDYEIDSRMYF